MGTNQKKTAEVKLAVCACGCGEHVAKGRLFRPGHDARHAGNIGRALADSPNDAKVKAQFKALSPALQTKAEGVRTKAVAKAIAKEKRAEAKVAKAEADAA